MWLVLKRGFSCLKIPCLIVAQSHKYVCIIRAGVPPTLNPYAETFIAGPLR